ncbi:MAG: hypothetical protein FWE37_07355 [Spirochaetaceae bacterium]|nr:hypothetical protein [Spirochaetaceae bacterium]
MIVKLLFLLFFSYFLSAAPSEAIDEALFLGNKEQALRLLNEAIAAQPADLDLLLRRAQFFYNESLYQLALNDYLTLEALGYGLFGLYEQFTLYHSIYELYNRLDMATEALLYAQRFYAAFPDEELAASNLLWAYQKAFNFEEGITAAAQMLNSFPDSYIIKALLSLLYTAVFNYDRAIYFSESAINMALNQSFTNQNFLVTALYNQFLLEMRFYNYTRAEQALRRALVIADSPSIYRSFGSLYTNQLNFFMAYDYLLLSTQLEEHERQQFGRELTPLTTLNLIELHLAFGQTAEAERLLTPLKQNRAISWMRNYGINSSIYFEELYSFSAGLWQLRSRQLTASIKTPVDYLLYPFRKLRANLLHFYYNSKARSYALENGRQRLASGNLLPALRDFINAGDELWQTNLFIRAAQQLETSFINRPLPSYYAQLGHLRRDKELIRHALTLFDPLFERRQKAQALQNLIRLERNRQLKQSYIIELYQLNGSITQLYKLPIQLHISGESNRFNRRLRSYLRQAFTLNENSPYRLIISEQQGQLYTVLYFNDELLINESFSRPVNRHQLALAISHMIYSPF